jgi:asparagine synthase (glutamine-hydrolysing)
MYAFAFWNARQNSLLVARDPMGIKPFYFFLNENEFGFASETKALLSMGRIEKKIDEEGLVGFLRFGAIQYPSTLWQGIKSLDPGECMTLNRNSVGNLVVERKLFWEFPKENSWSEDGAVEFLQTELPRAVRDHLIADVPVGVFLSSGIDSTILAGLASEVHPGMRAFTVCFGDHKEFDEDRLAIETAKRFGLHHERFVISEKEALDSFEGWLAAMDQPSIDGLNTFIISKAVRERGIKVALSGLGADELFGGYPSFREIPNWSRRIQNIQWLPKAIRKVASRLFGLGRGRVASGKMMDAICSDGSPEALYQTRRGLFDFNWIERFLGRKLPNQGKTESNGVEVDPVRIVQQLESRIYMGNMLLRDTDVCSMAHGLEVRVPFLDQKILNFAYSLPAQLISQPGRPGKFLLKKAFAKYLNEPLLGQPKRGFVLPFAKWYKGPLRAMCQERLNRIGFLDPAEVNACWDALDEPSMASRITALLSLTA